LLNEFVEQALSNGANGVFVPAFNRHDKFEIFLPFHAKIKQFPFTSQGQLDNAQVICDRRKLQNIRRVIMLAVQFQFAWIFDDLNMPF